MKNKKLFLFEIFRGFMAISVSILVATIFIFIISENPSESLRYMLISPIISFRGGNIALNINGFYTILAAMIPTIFTGLAVCVMFSANQFNLGAEGSVMLGGFIGALSGVYIITQTPFDAVIAVILAGLVCGIIMLIPALGKVRLNASEMVSSLMLNYVILFLILHFLTNNFADKSKGSIMTFPFSTSAKIPNLVPGNSHLTWGFVIAIIFTILTTLFMYRTKWGYQIRMIGINKEFAKYSGMKVGSVILLSQAIGGMLSGFGGAIEILGRFDTFSWLDLPGYGWEGITIAILAKNNPAFVPFAAFFIAYLNKGCQLMSTYCDVPSEMIDIIQAVIFLFFAAENFLANYRQKIVVKTTIEEMNLTEKGGAKA